MKQLFFLTVFFSIALNLFPQSPILQISENSDCIHLTGRIDKFPIEMALFIYGGGDGVFVGTKIVSGYYYYSNIRKPINLIGEFSAKNIINGKRVNGAEIELYELNSEYEKKAKFKGTFVDTIGFSGSWSQSDSNKVLEFILELKSYNLTVHKRKSFTIEIKVNNKVYQTDIGQEFHYKPILDDYVCFKSNGVDYVLASVFYWSNGVGNGLGNCGSGQEKFIYFFEIDTNSNSFKVQHFQIESCVNTVFNQIKIDDKHVSLDIKGWRSKINIDFKKIEISVEYYNNSTFKKYILSKDKLTTGFYDYEK